MVEGAHAVDAQGPAPHAGRVPLRPAAEVMDLERLGRLHASRISFIRTIVRKFMNERWQIECLRFDLDRDGYGTAIYRVRTSEHTYNFVLFSQYLDDSQRTDRVIANAWDCAFALVQGDVDEERLQWLRENVPKQEEGRCDPSVLVLSRANRSVRNFESIVQALSEGRQPDPLQIAKVGYLYRTTAVYGNGKFGLADYPKIRNWGDFGLPFSAQMFTVYLLRHFSIRQVEHIAAARAPQSAVAMDRRLQRYLGIGNSTGLGMAPFLINHPKLINQWLLMRETALARALGQPADAGRRARLRALVERAEQHTRETWVDDERQARENETLVEQLGAAREWLAGQDADAGRYLWQELSEHARAHWSYETQELLHSLIIELYPGEVDELELSMGAAEQYDLVPEMTLAELIEIIERHYGWALAIDFDDPDAQYYFWYRSAEKEEPRIGVRAEEPGADREMPLDVARQARRCYDALQACRAELGERGSVVEFLLEHPELKGITRRIQSMSRTTYGDIRANLLDRDLLPMHLLRCKLSFFGVTKFDPRSSRWVRITLFQGAPLLEDIGGPFDDDWLLPAMPVLERSGQGS
ncbi:MAG: hypothetical protein U5K73_00345 [Halofilum sp. (in: g-proteobacteria)]|nr:hypothetical protein [Halofilum sp. (in: g-proteobacteria)]